MPGDVFCFDDGKGRTNKLSGLNSLLWHCKLRENESHKNDREAGMIKSMTLSAILLAFWLVLSGHYTPFLLTMGVLSSACTVYVVRRMDLVDEEVVPLQLRPGLVGYWIWLAGEILKSSWAVSRLILSRRPRLAQQFIFVPTSQKTEMGRVIFANSITLTPGTVTAVTRQNGFIVHALTDAAADAGALSDMDRRVAAVEAR